MTLAEVREAVHTWPLERSLYRLCLDAPPIDRTRRPPHLRWVMFDSGHYGAHARAYGLGRAGEALPDDLAGKLARAAWLAGVDARAAAMAQADVAPSGESAAGTGA